VSITRWQSLGTKMNFVPNKVSFEKAKTSLGFQPLFSIQDMVQDLFSHKVEYGDYGKDEFYNIRTFKKIEW